MPTLIGRSAAKDAFGRNVLLPGKRGEADLGDGGGGYVGGWLGGNPELLGLSGELDEKPVEKPGDGGINTSSGDWTSGGGMAILCGLSVVMTLAGRLEGGGINGMVCGATGPSSTRDTPLRPLRSDTLSILWTTGGANCSSCLSRDT